MSYLDNLIALGRQPLRDRLARGSERGDAALRDRRRDSRPAARGHHPAAARRRVLQRARPKLDAFANAMVDIENVMGPAAAAAAATGGGIRRPQTFYFKIPPNDKLLGYWTTVADRLFKLRHCQNIQGVTRQLALFDAPIDPGLLIGRTPPAWTSARVLNDLQAHACRTTGSPRSTPRRSTS